MLVRWQSVWMKRRRRAVSHRAGRTAHVPTTAWAWEHSWRVLCAACPLVEARLGARTKRQQVQSQEQEGQMKGNPGSVSKRAGQMRATENDRSHAGEGKNHAEKE